jgi:hypothetical protein
MQIELNEKMQDALGKAAAAAGMSISGYANLLMEEQLARDSQTAIQRIQAVDMLIELLRPRRRLPGGMGAGGESSSMKVTPSEFCAGQLRALSWCFKDEESPSHWSC